MRKQVKTAGFIPAKRAYDEVQTMYGTASSKSSAPRAARREDSMEPRMKHRLGLKSWATGAMVLAAVSACSSNGSDPEPSASPSAVTSTPAATSSSASPTDPSARASTEAEAAVKKYYSVLDSLGADPKSSLSKLGGVATSTQLSSMRNVLRQQHQHKERQVGSLVVAKLKVQSVNLDNSNPSAGKVPAVVVDVCWDVSKVDILNAAGKSVISPDRPDRGWTRLTVANYSYARNPDHGWRVASGQDLKQAPCAAS